MKNKLLLGLLLGWLGHAAAQFSAGNTLEYQVGNLPHEQPSDLTALYNQLNFSYQFRDWRGDIKLERFQRPRQERDYTELTQRTLRYNRGGFDLAAGNFYEILGRGLLLRSYEIPGTILENPGERIRYGFYRDIDGALAKFTSERLDVKLLRGKPLRNTFPPQSNARERRPFLLDAFETNVRLLENFTIGGAYLREHGDEVLREFGSLAVSGNVSKNIQFYSEYAQRLDGGNQRFDLSDRSAHAFYSSANFVAGAFGLSVEYKDYNEFLLEYNDPPPLIKEHPYAVLNRSTHLINPKNETGWQGEAFWHTAAGQTFVLNFTQSENLFFGRKIRFEELFAEAGLTLSEKTTVKGFFDRSADQLRREKDRYAGGIYWEREWAPQWGTALDLEYQTLKRDFDPGRVVRNYVASLTLSKAPKISAGLILERSTDPNLTDLPNTARVETKRRHWAGYTLGYQFNQRYLMNVFYGTRRGGPACTSGICYEVLDFKGFEMRANLTF